MNLVGRLRKERELAYAALRKELAEQRKEIAVLRGLIDQCGELSTGWKFGQEGIHLLRINSLCSGRGNPMQK